MQPDVLVPDQVNCAQYAPGQRRGHYESFYQRANHPSRPIAFWLRYTVFSPAGRPADAVGELWAVVFDGETGTHRVSKTELPIGSCAFARDTFDVRVGSATLRPGTLSGASGPISWDLVYHGSQEPLYLLPHRMYRGGFPKAKSLVGLPLARYDGTLNVDGREIIVDGWLGSQNHNWGSRHTDRYAFGQVAGFDGAPDAFLEVVRAQTRIGPVWTPPLTLLVLRRGDRELAITGLRQARRADGQVSFLRPDATSWWTFATGDATTRVEGYIEAPRSSFVGLAYANPPGGTKHCLNTKIARCSLSIVDTTTGRREELHSVHGALFEILTDERGHGIPISA
jgi:hypothetical protein